MLLADSQAEFYVSPRWSYYNLLQFLVVFILELGYVWTKSWLYNIVYQINN